MSTTYRYLATEEENQKIFDWFSNYSVEKLDSSNAVHLWFREIGALAYRDNGELDQKNSPIVSIYPVRRIRGGSTINWRDSLLARTDERHISRSRINK